MRRPKLKMIGTVFAAIGLAAMLAGCITDGASDTAGTSLRYYGGPKSPMWAN